MRRRVERAAIRIDPCDPSPGFLKSCFAQVFAELDARPRRLLLDVYAENEEGRAATIDLADGNPVFAFEGMAPVRADFRRRWLAEHDVPLVLRRRGATRLELLPTGGNRVKVRHRLLQISGSSALWATKIWYNMRSSKEQYG